MHFRRPTFRCPRGFTLVEMMVAIAIIILVLGIAMAMFDSLRGTRSLDAGQNLLSAKLQRARALAIGLQERRGVFIFKDPKTRATAMVIIKVTSMPNPNISATPTATPAPFVVVDIDLDNDDIEYLPDGVGAAFMTAYMDTTTGATGTQSYRPYGTIMFDSVGRLDTVQCTQTVATTELVRRFGFPIPNSAASPSHAAAMLFDQKGIDSVPTTGIVDPRIFTPDQIKWLHNNCRALVINRYNGTVIKAD